MIINPEQPIRYDAIDKHETAFTKHPVKVKKARRVKRVKIKTKDDE